MTGVQTCALPIWSSEANKADEDLDEEDMNNDEGAGEGEGNEPEPTSTRHHTGKSHSGRNNSSEADIPL